MVTLVRWARGDAKRMDSRSRVDSWLTVGAILTIAGVLCAGCATVVEIAPAFPDEAEAPDFRIAAFAYEQLGQLEQDLVGVTLPTTEGAPEIDLALPPSELPELTGDPLPGLGELIPPTEVDTQTVPLDEVVLEDLEL